MSSFLLSYLYVMKLIRNTKAAVVALGVFLGGIILNEALLAIQGIASFSYITVPFANEMLFMIALLLFAGAVLLNIIKVNRHDEIAEE